MKTSEKKLQNVNFNQFSADNSIQQQIEKDDSYSEPDETSAVIAKTSILDSLPVERREASDKKMASSNEYSKSPAKLEQSIPSDVKVGQSYNKSRVSESKSRDSAKAKKALNDESSDDFEYDLAEEDNLNKSSNERDRFVKQQEAVNKARE